MAHQLNVNTNVGTFKGHFFPLHQSQLPRHNSLKLSFLKLAWGAVWNLPWFDSGFRVWHDLSGLQFLLVDYARSNI